MQPINYMAMVPQQDFLKDIMGGLQAGETIRQLAAADTQRRQAMALQQQYQADLQAHFANPTPQGAAALVAKYPQQREALTESWKTLTDEQKRGELKAGNMVFSALQNGRTELAAQVMADRIAALKNAGMPTADEERVLELINTNPEQAKGVVGYTLASIDDKFADNYAKMMRAPADARKADADARTAEVAAANAPDAAALANEAKAQEIKSAQFKMRIDELNTQIAQADSETRRGQLVLERQKLETELAKLQQGAVTGAQDQMDTLTQTLDTVKLVLEHRGLKSGTGMGGDFMSWFNGTDAADFRALVGTLKSQQFLANVATLKGAGALSDAEGARLERATASLDTSQSPEQFRNAVGVIKSTLEKAQAKLLASGKVPTAGTSTPIIMRHPTYGDVREADINRMMGKYGQTRERVMQFLRETGGK